MPMSAYWQTLLLGACCLGLHGILWAYIHVTPPAHWNGPPNIFLALVTGHTYYAPMLWFHISLFTPIFISHITLWVDSRSSLTPLGHHSTQLPHCLQYLLTPLSFLIQIGSCPRLIVILTRNLTYQRSRPQPTISANKMATERVIWSPLWDVSSEIYVWNPWDKSQKGVIILLFLDFGYSMTGVKFCIGHFVSRNGGIGTRLLNVSVRLYSWPPLARDYLQ